MFNSDRIRRPLAISAFLLVATGCEQGREQADDHQEHAGHVIPDHKPRSFPDAVRRLKALDREIGLTPADEKKVSMATDIAGWLPEVAAESDMPEAPWVEVEKLSSALVAGYRAIRGAPGGREDSARSTGRDVAALEAILSKSDPRWFDDLAGASGPR